MNEVIAQLDDLLSDAFSSGPASKKQLPTQNKSSASCLHQPTSCSLLDLVRHCSTDSNYTDCRQRLSEIIHHNGRTLSIQLCGYALIHYRKILFKSRTMVWITDSSFSVPEPTRFLMAL